MDQKQKLQNYEMSLQSVVEESKSLGLWHDHENHQVLLNAANSIVGIEGIVCELGLRRGGGLMTMLISCVNNNDAKNRQFIAIDPYGNIDYKFRDNSTVKLDYTNKMKNETLASLYSYCATHDIDFNLYCLTDFDFFDKFENGIFVYNENRFILNKYALVHLDGPHSTEDLIKEVNFFKRRMSLGGYIVLDDVQGYFNLEQLESAILIEDDFILVENDGQKASYKKIK